MKHIKPTGVGIILVAVTLIARAFWSIFLPFNDHQDITNAAIGTTPFTFNNQPYNFSPLAIDAINIANGNVDETSKNPYLPTDHFDGQTFALGVHRLAWRRNEFNILLAKPSISAADQQNLWQLLGFMLHAIQDFYAHSTWVEKGKMDIVGFAALTENTSAPDLTYLQTPTGTVCAAAGFPLILPVTQLTSGYYNPTDLLGSTDPAPTGLCQHGTLIQAAATCKALFSFPPIPTQVQGISKDSPCALYLQGPLTSHFIAKSLAQKETLDFVNTIVEDLNGNAAGFCALLGLDSTIAICANNIVPPPPPPPTSPYTIYWTYNNSYTGPDCSPDSFTIFSSTIYPPGYPGGSPTDYSTDYFVDSGGPLPITYSQSTPANGLNGPSTITETLSATGVTGGGMLSSYNYSDTPTGLPLVLACAVTFTVISEVCTSSASCPTLPVN